MQINAGLTTPWRYIIQTMQCHMCHAMHLLHASHDYVTLLLHNALTWHTLKSQPQFVSLSNTLESTPLC